MAHDYSNLSLSQLIEKLNFYDLINKLKETFKKLKNQVDTNTSTIETLEESTQNVGLNYKSYVALVSQSGVNPPDTVVMFNSIGNINFTRQGEGVYAIESNSLFKENKTIVIANNAISAQSIIGFDIENGESTIIMTNTFLDETQTLLNVDGIGLFSLEIRVYN